MEFYKRYIKAQKDAGADAIWLGDCNAFSSMVPADLYVEHILPVTKKLVQYCEKELDIMIWMHNSETTWKIFFRIFPSVQALKMLALQPIYSRFQMPLKGKLLSAEILIRWKFCGKALLNLLKPKRPG